jgi:hypothetical protein
VVLLLVQPLAVVEPVTATDTEDGRGPAVEVQVTVTVLPLATAMVNAAQSDVCESKIATPTGACSHSHTTTHSNTDHNTAHTAIMPTVPAFSHQSCSHLHCLMTSCMSRPGCLKLPPPPHVTPSYS